MILGFQKNLVFLSNILVVWYEYLWFCTTLWILANNLIGHHTKTPETVLSEVTCSTTQVMYITHDST